MEEGHTTEKSTDRKKREVIEGKARKKTYHRGRLGEHTNDHLPGSIRRAVEEREETG